MRTHACVEIINGFSRLYDHQFLEPGHSDDQKCPICHLVVRNAYQVNCCGKILCEDCLMEYCRQFRKCLMCRTHIGDKYFKDTRSDREIKSLKVYCDNKEAGCDWTGEVRRIEKHLERCGYQEIECEKCEEAILDLEMKTHISNECPMRDYKCSLCKKQDTFQSITVDHPKVCPEVVSKCPNRGCSKRLKRRNMPSHLEVCTKQIVDCPFKVMECSFTSKREKIMEHVENEISSHLELVAQSVENFHPTPAGAVVKLKCIIFDGAANIPVFTDSFYSGREGYKLRLKVYPNMSGHVAVYLQLMPGPNDDTLQFPMRGEFTVTLLNQIEDHNHYEHVLAFDERTDDTFNRKYKDDDGGRGYHEFIPHSSLPFNRATNTQYFKDSFLYFRVDREPSSESKPWLFLNDNSI